MLEIIILPVDTDSSVVEGGGTKKMLPLFLFGLTKDHSGTFLSRVVDRRA